MAEIITDGSQKELKKHGSDEFPLLVSYEKLSGYKSGSFLWHWHPEIEITLVLDGQILYKVNQCTYHMKQEISFLEMPMYSRRLHGRYERWQICVHHFSAKDYLWFYESILRRKYVEPFFTELSPFLQSILIIHSPGMKFFPNM